MSEDFKLNSILLVNIGMIHAFWVFIEALWGVSIFYSCLGVDNPSFLVQNLAGFGSSQSFIFERRRYEVSWES